MRSASSEQWPIWWGRRKKIKGGLWRYIWWTMVLNSFSKWREERVLPLCVKGTSHWSFYGVTALTHQQFPHSKNQCRGRLDVLGRDQRPAVTGWMGHNVATCEQAGLLFKWSGQSPSMCTSPLRHGEQRDACVEPLLAYCRAGLRGP